MAQTRPPIAARMFMPGTNARRKQAMEAQEKPIVQVRYDSQELVRARSTRSKDEIIALENFHKSSRLKPALKRLIKTTRPGSFESVLEMVENTGESIEMMAANLKSS